MNSIKKIGLTLLWESGIGPLFRVVREPKILILAYHSIHNVSTNSDYAHISISKGNFEAQISYIERRGYRFIHFRDLLKHPQEKVVAIYFDDGFKDVLENAYLTLKNRGIPATLFVTTDYADQKKEAGKYLTWEQIKTMSDVFEFGSHSVSHIKLNKASLDVARDELSISKKIIEEKTGAHVVSFSYPYGRSSNELENIAKEVGYELTTADARLHKARPDLDDAPDVFRWKLLRLWS